jgi:uncharacterized protein
MAEGLGIRVTLVNGDPAALAERIVKREIDALFFGAGAPVPAFTRLADTADIVFMPLEGAASDALRRAYPYMTQNNLPAGIYRGQTASVPTVALWNFVVAREDMPTDIVAAVAQAVLSDPAQTRTIHPAAAATLSTNVVANTFLPFHPGALQFLEAAGIKTSSLPR